MPDREKVIDGVQFCFSENHGCIHCNGCPYEKDRVLGKACPLGKDVLALLKEQEAKTVIKIAKRCNDCDLTGYCPFCSRPLIKDWAENYCGYCGKPILWEGR